MQNLNVKWTSQRIHSLRLRLGWTCNDLARRLECEPSEILSWEKQLQIPDSKFLPILEFVEHQAESVSQEIHDCAVAECKLESTSQSQILLDELM